MEDSTIWLNGYMEMFLAIPFGLAIGLVVGTVGGGGAILALPVLVYVLGRGQPSFDGFPDRRRDRRLGRRGLAGARRTTLLAGGLGVLGAGGRGCLSRDDRER